MGTQDRSRCEAEMSVSLRGPWLLGATRVDLSLDMFAELVGWSTEEVADV